MYKENEFTNLPTLCRQNVDLRSILENQVGLHTLYMKTMAVWLLLSMTSSSTVLANYFPGLLSINWDFTIVHLCTVVDTMSSVLMKLSSSSCAPSSSALFHSLMIFSDILHAIHKPSISTSSPIIVDYSDDISHVSHMTIMAEKVT